jgi:hypothetical protein
LGPLPVAPLWVDFIATQSRPPCRSNFRDKAKLEPSDETQPGLPALGRFTASGTGSNDEPDAAQGKNKRRHQLLLATNQAFLSVEFNICQFASRSALRGESSGPKRPAFARYNPVFILGLPDLERA